MDSNRTRVLLVDDSPTARALGVRALTAGGYEPVVATNGEEALRALEGPQAPALAILDWMLPDVEGPEICARVRARPGARYLILLTAKQETEDVVAGLEAGADDFLRKPFEPAELQSRLRVGERILGLQQNLEARVGELQAALDHVRQLQGIIPICMFCKRIRDDGDAWHQLEAYLSQHTDAQFSHSLCRECLLKHYPEAAGGK